MEAIWDDGRGNLDCHWKMRVYWIGTENHLKIVCFRISKI